MPFIELSKRSRRHQKFYVEVDEIDYEFLMHWSWYAAQKYRPTNDQITPRRSTRINGKSVCVYMHRAIAERMGLDMNRKIGHLDDNTLNNKRSNIGYKDNPENLKPKFDETGVVTINTEAITSHKGIIFNQRLGKYIAKITFPADRVTVRVGNFDSLDEAVAAREKRLEELKYTPCIDLVKL